jgi:hypothetical protein
VDICVLGKQEQLIKSKTPVVLIRLLLSQHTTFIARCLNRYLAVLEIVPKVHTNACCQYSMLTLQGLLPLRQPFLQPSPDFQTLKLA